MADFTALDAALTGAGIASDQLPIWRMLYHLENQSRADANGVPIKWRPVDPAKFIAYLQQQGVLDAEAP